MEEYLREKKREYSEERKVPYSLEDLRNIMKILRSDEGCPWDRRQTFESMIPCVTEEAEEVAQAVKRQDMDNLCEELGDVLGRYDADVSDFLPAEIIPDFKARMMEQT